MATEITCLETSDMLLTESICCIEKVQHKIKQTSGKTKDTILKKNWWFPNEKFGI